MTHTLESIVLGGGCFWCLDAAYRMIKGVHGVTSGYAGGSSPNPTYSEVSRGTTGHAEVVRVEFDPAVITLAQILEIFWVLHNPTTPNRQGNDIGPQYRSMILCSSQQQKETVEASVIDVEKLWDAPIVTEIGELKAFYPAEEEHQNYFTKNPHQGYCQVIINPKLNKLRERFERYLA